MYLRKDYLQCLQYPTQVTTAIYQQPQITQTPHDFQQRSLRIKLLIKKNKFPSSQVHEFNHSIIKTFKIRIDFFQIVK